MWVASASSKFLTALVDELRSTSRTFDTLWHTARTGAVDEDRAVLRHPDGSDVTLGPG
jgi:hypothetical protein